MTRFDIARRFGLGVVAVAAAGLLAACGQGSSSTRVVLSGPADKVEALIAEHHLNAAPVEAQVEKLPDGGERAAFTKPGMPTGQLIALGKAAARAGVSFEFSSGSQWSAGEPRKSPPARTGGPIV